jgi:hypothetical protein
MVFPVTRVVLRYMLKDLLLGLIAARCTPAAVAVAVAAPPAAPHKTQIHKVQPEAAEAAEVKVIFLVQVEVEG